MDLPIDKNKNMISKKSVQARLSTHLVLDTRHIERKEQGFGRSYTFDCLAESTTQSS